MPIKKEVFKEENGMEGPLVVSAMCGNKGTLSIIIVVKMASS